MGELEQDLSGLKTSPSSGNDHISPENLEKLVEINLLFYVCTSGHAGIIVVPQTNLVLHRQNKFFPYYREVNELFSLFPYSCLEHVSRVSLATGTPVPGCLRHSLIARQSAKLALEGGSIHTLLG